MKILALYAPPEFSQYCSADVYPLYKELHGLQRTLFKLYEHVHFCDVTRWLEDWKYKIAEYDVIFIFDGVRGRDVIEYIRDHNKRARIIIYYINPVDYGDRKAPHHYKGLDCEFYTFDPIDAKKFGIKFKPYFYPEEYMIDCDEKVTIKQDVFFVGVDKDRLGIIKDLHRRFEQMNLTDELMVVATPHKKYSRSDEKWLAKRVPYEKIAENIKQSRAILDIVQSGQSGITLRPMEAMFYNKKLITNNIHIKEYDFYTPRNIFILQERNISELKEFLDLPIIEIAQEIKNKYRFSGGWMKDFLR